MIDYHDRCEWVNVSFGTGSPTLSQSPESRKMVVLVIIARDGAWEMCL